MLDAAVEETKVISVTFYVSFYPLIIAEEEKVNGEKLPTAFFALHNRISATVIFGMY